MCGIRNFKILDHFTYEQKFEAKFVEMFSKSIKVKFDSGLWEDFDGGEVNLIITITLMVVF